MPVDQRIYIAFVGAGKCSGKGRDMAASAGRYVAENGGVVVCGGLGGVMEGVARGAKEGGGTTIGLLPGSDRREANDYIDYAIPTGFGEARNIMVVRCADAVVAFPGKFGTLSEMAFAMKLGKPLVSVSAWTLGDDVRQEADPVEAAKLAMQLAKDQA